MNTLKIIVGNLGMFVITLVIGLKMLLKKEKTGQKEEIKENNIEENSTNKEMQSQENTSNNREETKKEENKSSVKDQQTSEDKNIEQENVQETVKEPEIIEKNNRLSIGILGISAIFLIISITFFIKYQLKEKSKASK